MNIPPFLLYAIQGFLLVSAGFLLWAARAIRVHGRTDMILGRRQKPLEVPALVTTEFRRYYSFSGMMLIGVVVVWNIMSLTLVTATILTTVVTLVMAAWRASLINLHDNRYKMLMASEVAKQEARERGYLNDDSATTGQ